MKRTCITFVLCAGLSACIAGTGEPVQESAWSEPPSESPAMPPHPKEGGGSGISCGGGLIMGPNGELLEVPVECAPLDVQVADPPPEQASQQAEAGLPQ
jgi:hypothetical protein